MQQQLGDVFLQALANLKHPQCVPDLSKKVCVFNGCRRLTGNCGKQFLLYFVKGIFFRKSKTLITPLA